MGAMPWEVRVSPEGDKVDDTQTNPRYNTVLLVSDGSHEMRGNKKMIGTLA